MYAIDLWGLGFSTREPLGYGYALYCGMEMHRILKGSRLEIIDEAGHLANFDRPDAFNRLVIDFLQEQV